MKKAPGTCAPTGRRVMTRLWDAHFLFNIWKEYFIPIALQYIKLFYNNKRRIIIDGNITLPTQSGIKDGNLI